VATLDAVTVTALRQSLHTVIKQEADVVVDSIVADALQRVTGRESRARRPRW